MEMTKMNQIRKRTDKLSLPSTSRKRKKERKTENIKEVFGVHVINDADIESHFGGANVNIEDMSKKRDD